MERMLSGIKPTGKLTLGNYIGALSNFVKLQEEYEMMVFIANLHAITVGIDPVELKENTRDMAALYIACGLDPEKVTLFIIESSTSTIILLLHTPLVFISILSLYFSFKLLILSKYSFFSS